MENNNQKPESIWADGCPANVKEEMKMNFKDLLGLSLKVFVDNYAIPKGYKVEQINGDPSKFPNLFLKKDDVLYAVIIGPFFYPQFGFLKDEVRLDFLKQMEKINAVSFFVPMLIVSTDMERTKAGLALRGDVFTCTIKGFCKLTNDPVQTLDFKTPLPQELK